MLIATGRYTIHEMVNIFGNTRHIIEFDTPENLVPILREYIPEDRALIIEKTYSRAHRGLDENYKQSNRLYYWPNFNKKLQEYIKNCIICNSNKYNRHPVLIPIG